MTAPQAPAPIIFTVGHSNHAPDRFLALLGGAGITTLIDVRSAPFSRRWPQFNRDRLAGSLAGAGIAYRELGAALGGRPREPALWRGARPDYAAIARSPAFNVALTEVAHAARSEKICLMCAEREPLDCHRCLLVARALAGRGLAVKHLLADGAVEDHAATERRLLAWAELAAGDLFASDAERLEKAYDRRAAWIWGDRS